MAKFCRSCGSPLDEGAETCAKCGASVHAPVTPAKQESSVDWKGIWNSIVTTVKKGVAAVAKALRKLDLVKIQAGYQKVLPFVMIVVAVLCIITFVLQTFGTYNIKVTATFAGESMSASGPISDLYQEDEFVGVCIVNILYGICSLALAALALVPFISAAAKSKLLKKLFQNIALLGVIINVVYLILFAISGNLQYSMGSLSVDYHLSVHFTAWINLVVFILMAAMSNALPLLIKSAPAEAPSQASDCE